MIDFEEQLGQAVKHFWNVRDLQKEVQGSRTGRKDAGDRTAVTGGKHAEGFVQLVAGIVKDAALADTRIHISEKRPRTLPGFYRPCKEWDLVVLSGSALVAVVEIKSQVGSFGNNFNNRVEEAIGNAADFWAAYREGAFKPSSRPWLGYLFMLEETPASLRPTKRIVLDPYKVDEAFQSRSYAQRYELVCERLVRDRMYDAACFITSDAATGREGHFKQPNEELSITNFAISLQSRATVFARLGGELQVREATPTDSGETS